MTATPTPNPTQPAVPAPVSGTITFAIEGKTGTAVYGFTCTPRPDTRTKAERFRAPCPGWVVRGTYNGKSLPLEYTTADANPIVAARTWLARVIAGGG